MKSKFFIVAFFMLAFSITGKAQELTMYPSFFKIQFYEDKIEIDRSRFESLLESVPESYTFLNKSKRQRNIAIAALVAELGFFAWAIGTIDNDSIDAVPLVGGFAMAGVSLGFSLSSAKNLKESILTYNDKKTSFSSINIGPTYNGLGIVLGF